jgi:hypothetical protein
VNTRSNSLCATLTLALLAVLTITGWADSAHAQARRGPLVILGLRAANGDDEAAENMTLALRQAARSAGFDSSGDAPPLEQAMAMFSCEEPLTVACLRQIAEDTGNKKMLYGTARHTGNDRNAPVRFEISLFDPATGTQTPGTPVEVARAIAIDSDSLLNPARRILNALLPAPPPPTTQPGQPARKSSPAFPIESMQKFKHERFSTRPWC